VRPQTYEDPEEAAFLKSTLGRRSGDLENTVFCVFAPDGQERLTRAGRSPQQQFADPAKFASFLESSFEPYAGDAEAITQLPLHDELALALNVASCDSVPLVVLTAESAQELARLEQRVAALAWTGGYVGRQHFVSQITAPIEDDAAGEDAPAADQGARATDLELEHGVTIVQAGPYGLTAQVLHHVPPSADPAELAEALTHAYAAHDPAQKERQEHVRNARRNGISWDSEIPVTDSRAGRRR